MVIIVDIDDAGHTHFINTDETQYFMPSHPVTGAPVTPKAFLAAMNADPKLRTAGGWDVVRRLPGEAVAMSRWQRLVAAANHVDADAEVKALGLK